MVILNVRWSLMYICHNVQAAHFSCRILFVWKAEMLHRHSVWPTFVLFLVTVQTHFLLFFTNRLLWTFWLLQERLLCGTSYVILLFHWWYFASSWHEALSVTSGQYFLESRFLDTVFFTIPFVFLFIYPHYY